LFSRESDLDAFFQVGLKLCTVLAALHRQDFAHYHLNPWSVLLHAETKEVYLIDFTLAATATDSVWEPLSPQALHQALAYLSPEQTGRMNRTADYRADFYSLGILFYELLTGVLPFDTSDMLELIHSHLARSPRSPKEMKETIPEPLSQIIMKLLAKSPDQRYQSALGLKHDLEYCAREWATHGQLASFPLGQHDVSDRFLLPQKLYGRQQEFEQLLAAFDGVCAGSAAFVLISGYSGIGKTKLVQELSKSIVRQRGAFITGKFDQVTRNLPYGALIQALRSYVHQLLTENEEQLAQWRMRIAQAVGVNSGVLIEVIPELALILGPSPPPLPLEPTEAQNRFRLVFQSFIGVLARKEHPLVVFLDDLQWADAATLHLLPSLLTSLDIQSLLLIGAYRDNEVDANHLLTHLIQVLETASVTLHRLALQPLTLPEVSELLTDTLRGTLQEVLPLAQLMVQKTEGNPFFLLQFLKTLRHERVLEFEHERGRWNVRLEAINNLALADNVTDLMARKIQHLAPRTQRALTLAACIGNQFELRTLATVSQQPFDITATDLKEALEEGLLFPVSRSYYVLGVDAGAAIATTYRFLHDRVQQAAYGLIAEERRQQRHLTIGRLLLAGYDSTVVEEKLFDIVQHLNKGGALIVDEAERLNLARLNLRAGRKAKTSTAYQTAVGYLTTGLSLLATEQWETDYDLTFSLHLEAAESLSLNGQFSEAERLFQLLLQRARTHLDKAQVYNLWVAQYEHMSRYGEAVRVGREGLAIFGVSFPEAEEAKHAALNSELATIQTLLGHRTIASLSDLPLMQDQKMRMVMKLLTTLWAPAYVADDQTLTRLISATLVRLSLLHGHIEESAFGYVTYAITIGSVQGDYQAEYEFGELALRVNELFNDGKRRAKIHHLFSCFVNPWRKPLTTCFPYAREAQRSGLETGDFAYVTYGAFHESWYGLLTSQDLARFVRDYTPNIPLLQNIRAASFIEAQKLIINWAHALQGLTDHPLSLSDADFQERDYQEAHKTDAFFLTFFHIIRLHLHVTFAEYDKALMIAD
jgi:predicted ATPase